MRGVNNMTGVALMEVYDLSGDANSIRGKISTRALVQTGDNVMIGEFIVQGLNKRGHSARHWRFAYSIWGSNTLANPILERHDGTGALIVSNNNWAATIIGGIITANQVRDIEVSGYAPGDGMESAIIADLPPGNYTAVVRGTSNTIGVALKYTIWISKCWKRRTDRAYDPNFSREPADSSLGKESRQLNSK
jgi:hypothetical protein